MVGSDVPHIFAMSMFGDYIYWTDWDQRRVKRAHKFTGQDQLDLVLVVHRPMDIQVLHPLRQPRSKYNHRYHISNTNVYTNPNYLFSCYASGRWFRGHCLLGVSVLSSCFLIIRISQEQLEGLNSNLMIVCLTVGRRLE